MVGEPTGENPVKKVEQRQPEGEEGHKPVACKMFEITSDHAHPPFFYHCLSTLTRPFFVFFISLYYDGFLTILNLPLFPL